ncbi:GNA1162 family protein [Xanthomonas populi]|uniref:GNA1162 family protein n=1 Tax=Xanthomonas populi TaxID=53414 RepID=UPI003CCDAF23
MQPVSRDDTAYRASKPRSILVLPPLSHAPDEDAGLSVLSVTTLPLAEAGYDVMPLAPVYETFRSLIVAIGSATSQVSDCSPPAIPVDCYTARITRSTAPTDADECAAASMR